MAELFIPADNQQRIKMLVKNANTVLRHPSVLEVIHTIGGRTSLGWGLAEYRRGSSVLSTTPTSEEIPAEIAFYPRLTDEITGSVYWHGEGSNALRFYREVVSMCMDRTAEDGQLVHFMSVRAVGRDFLDVGRPNDPEQMAPITVETFDLNEARLAEYALTLPRAS